MRETEPFYCPLSTDIKSDVLGRRHTAMWRLLGPDQVERNNEQPAANQGQDTRSE